MKREVNIDVLASLQADSKWTYGEWEAISQSAGFTQVDLNYWQMYTLVEVF